MSYAPERLARLEARYNGPIPPEALIAARADPDAAVAAILHGRAHAHRQLADGMERACRKHPQAKACRRYLALYRAEVWRLDRAAHKFSAPPE